MPQKGNFVTHDLPEAMDIFFAQSFFAKAAELAQTEKNIRLKANSVKKVTSSCAQILLSLIKTVEAAGKKVSIENPSEEFKASLKTLGLTEQLAVGATNE